MIVDLNEIEGSSRPFELAISPEELDFTDPGFRLTGDVTVAAEVTRSIAEVHVRGSINGAAEMDCSRCLRPIPSPLAIDFSVSFVSPEHFASNAEHEVAVEDLDTDVIEKDQIDLRAVVREQILLNLPEQTFCDPDCKGLCPQCGADLNLLDCTCDQDEIDPRWAALKDFRS